MRSEEPAPEQTPPKHPQQQDTDGRRQSHNQQNQTTDGQNQKQQRRKQTEPPAAHPHPSALVSTTRTSNQLPQPETERKETTDTAQNPEKTTATLTPDLGVYLTLCYVRKQWEATPLREINRRRAVTGSNDPHQPTKCGEELPTF